MNAIPTREEALSLLERVGLSNNIINHSIAVADKALEIAKKLNENGVTLDIQLVEIGALLHDIGRSKVHGWQHPIIGGEIIRENGFSDKLARIAETHILGGLSEKDCEILGLPVNRYIPENIEEKIVSYADKLTKGSIYISVEDRFNIWIEEYGNTPILKNAKKRVKKIEKEIQKLLKFKKKK
ncbi:MAG: HD domain-containing protein [Candidatus Helarchaeota archaeon]